VWWGECEQERGWMGLRGFGGVGVFTNSDKKEDVSRDRRTKMFKYFENWETLSWR